MPARSQQLARQEKPNSALQGREIEKHCALSAQQQTLLEKATVRLNLSVRAYHRILRVARTIADLEKSTDIHTNHLTEALNYRPGFNPNQRS